MQRTEQDPHGLRIVSMLLNQCVSVLYVRMSDLITNMTRNETHLQQLQIRLAKLFQNKFNFRKQFVRSKLMAITLEYRVESLQHSCIYTIIRGAEFSNQVLCVHVH